MKTRDNRWAHETGHLLGFYDEYATGAVGTAPRWKANNPTAVALADLRQEHRVSRFLMADDLHDVADPTKEVALAPGEDWQWSYRVPVPSVPGEYEHTMEHGFRLRTYGGEAIGVEVRVDQWKRRAP